MAQQVADTISPEAGRATRSRAWLRRDWGVLAICVTAVLLLLVPPGLPGAGLDPSWTLALEHAARDGLIFGQDFVFAYGPFGVLSTRLFDPGTFVFVLLGDLVLTSLFLAPLLWSRRPAILVLYAVAIPVAGIMPLAFDARVVIAFFVAFLLGVRERGRFAWLAVLLAGPFLLSKFSYALAVLPLLVLGDLYGLARYRRLPLLTAIALAEIVLGMVLTGHSLGALPGLAANIMEVISGYGGAMQSAVGGIYPLLAAAAALLVFLGLSLLALRRRGAALAAGGGALLPVATLFLGLAWVLFVAFKMGHVRQDLHIFITWQAFVLILPVLAAFLDAAGALQRRELIFSALLMGGSLLPIAALDAVNYLRFTNPSPLAYLRQRATDLAVRPLQTLAWLNPGHWHSMAEQRRTAEQAIAARLPIPARGSMDVIPFDSAPVIASAADYRPRPNPQSYSAYTPRLQALDAAHFESSAAPETLFFQLGDIDERLPTLATGPSLPVIARWYDAVGGSPLGLILHRRAVPRGARTEDAGAQDFALGDWIPVPAGPGALISARVDIGPNLLGRLLGFVAREPMLWITLRYGQGGERTFRYIPGMGRAGFILSPMPISAEVPVTATATSLRAAAGLIERSYAPDAVGDVTAIRFSSEGIGAKAYGGGHIAFERLLLEPGFTMGLRAASAPVPARSTAAPPPERR